MSAAIRVIAFQGLGAATATIAKEAGVSNGSLFTYFEMKSDLFNQLYVELKAEMASAAVDGLPCEADTRQQMLHMWTHWLRWATSCPEKRRTLAHLGASDEVTSRRGRACAPVRTAGAGPKRISYSLDGHAPGIADSPAGQRIAERHGAWAGRMPREASDLWCFVIALPSGYMLVLLAHSITLRDVQDGFPATAQSQLPALDEDDLCRLKAQGKRAPDLVPPSRSLLLRGRGAAQGPEWAGALKTGAEPKLSS